METNRIVIGIHGLSNKPPRETLETDWKKAIQEGLQRNEGRTAGDIPFELVYWRDWNYPNPKTLAEIDEPYRRAHGDDPLPTYKDGFWDTLRAEASELGGGASDWLKQRFGVSTEIIDQVLGLKFRDLALYYDDDTKREDLRSRFAKAVQKHAGKRIMVIAHSMGSIVAYDVLRELGQSSPQLEVGHCLTIGSPLGLPYVKYKIASENDRVRTPTVVRKWTNLADRRDLVAADTHLSDDFGPNVSGVQVRDDLVLNGYVSPAGKPNYHKIYGYLRTPELSALLRDFM